MALGSILQAVDQDGKTSCFPHDPRVLDDEMELVLGRGGFSEGSCRNIGNESVSGNSEGES